MQIDREVLKILRLGHPLATQKHANWPRGVKNSASWASIGDAEPCKLTERGAKNSSPLASLGDAEPCQLTKRCKEFCVLGIRWRRRAMQIDREVLRILHLGHPVVMQIDREVLRILRLGHPLVMQNHAN